MGTVSDARIKSGMQPNGMCRIYNRELKTWEDRFSVDARELIANGTHSLDGPDIEMIGPSGKIMVTESEVGSYVSRGFKLVDEGAVAPETEGEGKTDGDGSGGKKDQDPEPYNFMRHTVPELKQFAAQAKIDGADQMNKAQLCEALDKSKFRPTGS